MTKDEILNSYIIPTLNDLDLNSQEAQDLMIGTCKQESNLGQYVIQVGGPALGIYQCEPNTLIDIWNNYLAYNRLLFSKLRCIPGCEQLRIDVVPNPDLLVTNHLFSSAICRVHYLRVKDSIPSRKNTSYNDYINDLANYYKIHYNTPQGAAKIPMVIANFKTVITPY
jgi:hypothetical protein